MAVVVDRTNFFRAPGAQRNRGYTHQWKHQAHTGKTTKLSVFPHFFFFLLAGFGTTGNNRPQQKKSSDREGKSSCRMHAQIELSGHTAAFPWTRVLQHNNPVARIPYFKQELSDTAGADPGTLAGVGRRLLKRRIEQVNFRRKSVQAILDAPPVPRRWILVEPYRKPCATLYIHRLPLVFNAEFE